MINYGEVIPKCSKTKLRTSFSLMSRRTYVTRVMQKVLSLGSDYFSATFYQTYFYYKPSKYSPFTETQFPNLFTQLRKADSLLLVSVGDTDK